MLLLLPSPATENQCHTRTELPGEHGDTHLPPAALFHRPLKLTAPMGLSCPGFQAHAGHPGTQVRGKGRNWRCPPGCPQTAPPHRPQGLSLLFGAVMAKPTGHPWLSPAFLGLCAAEAGPKPTSLPLLATQPPKRIRESRKPQQGLPGPSLLHNFKLPLSGPLVFHNLPHLLDTSQASCTP